MSSTRKVTLSPRQIRQLRRYLANEQTYGAQMSYWRDSSINATTGIHRTMGVLVEKGMVIITVPDPSNRNSFQLTVTDAGRAFLAALDA